MAKTEGKYVVLILDDLIATYESDSPEQIAKVRKWLEELRPYLTGNSHVASNVTCDI